MTYGRCSSNVIHIWNKMKEITPDGQETPMEEIITTEEISDAIYIVIYVQMNSVETMGTGLTLQQAIEYFESLFGPATINDGYTICKKEVEEGVAYILKANN